MKSDAILPMQVEDHMIDEEEEELDKQYTAIKIDSETKVIGEA